MTEDDKSFSANAKGTDVDFGSRLTYGIAGGHIGDADSADINDLKAAFDGDKGMGNAHTQGSKPTRRVHHRLVHRQVYLHAERRPGLRRKVHG